MTEKGQKSPPLARTVFPFLSDFELPVFELLPALILLYFRGASYNPVSSRNKTKLIKSSSCSSSSLLSVLDDFYIF